MQAKEKETEVQAELATRIEDSLELAEENNLREQDENQQTITRGEFLWERNKKNKERAQMIIEAQRKLASGSAIESVRRARKIIYGEVIGTQTLEEKEETIVCAIIKMVEDPSVLMFVPFEEMYGVNPMDMSTADITTLNGQRKLNARKEQMLLKLIPLVIPVIIKKVIQGENPEERRIYASRAAACRILMERAYKSENPRIRKDETYDATVLSVSEFSMAATLYGVDFILKLSTLTNRYIRNLQEVYRPGDRIPVLVRDIVYEGDTISIDPDTLTPELNKAQSRWFMISPGTRAHATITKVKDASQKGKGINIVAWINGYNMPCKIKYMNANDFGREPIAGDSIRIRVVGFLPTKYIEAVCIGVNGNAGYFNR